MWKLIQQNINDIGVIFTVLTFFSLIVSACSAFRYVSVRRDELKNQRYEKYHSLLQKISCGSDIQGQLKLVSQRAFIYELRHFPEYRSLTQRLLESLQSEWKEDPEKNAKLSFEIEDTLKSLK